MRRIVLLVVLLVAARAAADGPTNTTGLAGVVHDQGLTGKGTNPVPLSIHLATGGGLTTVGGTAGLGIQPCSSGQGQVWNGAAYACGDITSKVAGTLNRLACFTPDGSHVGNCAATDDGTTLAILERASIAPPSGGAVGALLITGAPGYQLQTSGDTTPTFDFRTTSGLTTLQLTNDAPGGSFAVNINGNAFVSGAATTGSINGAVLALTLTDAGIQAAIDAAPPGGQVNLLSGSTYIMNAALPIVISKPLTIDCQGWGSPMRVAATVGGSTPVFLLKPLSATAVTGIVFRNCAITTASGAPASNAFAIDGTFGPIGQLAFDHVFMAQLGSFGIAVQNASGLTTGTPYNTQITGASVIYGGANFTNAGDTITIDGSTILAGVGSLIVDVATGAGGTAGSFVMDHATSVLSGGIVIKTVIEGSIRNSNLEQTVTSTESNNCLVDVQGNSGVGLSNFIVEGNYLGADSTKVGCAVRVDHATNTQIVRNYVSQGSVNAYTITANADRTRFIGNRQAPDNPISTFLSDSGTRTNGEFLNQASGAVTYYGLSAWSNAAGVTGVAINSARLVTNPTNGVFGVSSGDPSITGLQVALWSSGANAWRMGTGFGDATANLALGTLDVAGAATADAGLRIFDSPGTGLARDGVNPNKINLATLGTGAGSCTNCAVTFDAQGREVAYSSGTAPVTSISVTAPITTTGGVTPTIGLSLTTTSCSAGQHVNTINASGTGGCSADTDPGISGTIGRSARFGTTTTINTGAFTDDGTNATIGGTFGVSGAETASSTFHGVGAVTLDSTLTVGQTAVGTTNLGAEFNVVLANNTSGVEPSVWDNKWFVVGATGAGSSGPGLGTAYSSSTGVVMSAWAPGVGYKVLTQNALSFNWDLSHTVSMTLASTGDFAINTNKFTVAGSSGNAAVAGTLGVTGAVTNSSTEHTVGAVTFDSTLAVASTFTNAAHIVSLTSGGTPTALACGTGMTITGTDSAMIVTPGTGLTTGGCSLSFAHSYTNIPACTANGTNVGDGYITVTATNASVLLTDSTRLDYVGKVTVTCTGINGT